MGPQRMFGMTPWVWRLIVANLVVFLLQVTLFVSPAFLTTFGFVPLTALARPWTFLTYMFLHANFLHLAFNLLALLCSGRRSRSGWAAARFCATTCCAGWAARRCRTRSCSFGP